MPITAAQLAVRVVAETAPAEAGLGRVASLMGKGLPLMAVGAVAAVAGIGIAATKMAGDFQAGMVQLVTGAGESKNNLKLVSDGILNLATSTGTSTQQLLSAMFNIESGSFHGAAGLNVLKVAAEGAKASNSDLGTTATALVGIMNAYASQHITAAQAMNVLTGTVQNGLTHMQDLAGALPTVLSTASATGIKITDLAGAMATLTSQTIPAANASTYIRQLLIALDAPGKQAQKTLASIGLTTSDVSAAMKQSLPGALQLITDHLAKKFPAGSAQYIAALKDISGGSKTMQGMLDLTGSHLKTFKDDVANVSGVVKKGGSSIVGWSDVQNTFNFKMDRAKEVVETLMIRLGTGLLPIAGKVVDLFSTYFVPTLTALFNGLMTVVNTGGRFISFLQGTGPAATAVKGVLLLLGGALAGLAASAIPSAIVAITASVTAFGAQAIAAGAAAIATIAAAAPFILVGVAIAGVIGIIILIVTHLKQLGQWFDNLKQIARNAVEGILSLLSHVPGPIGAMASSVLASMKAQDDAVKAHTLSMKVAADMHTAAMAEAAVKNTDRMRRELIQQIQNTTDPAKKKALEMRLAVVDHTEKMQLDAVHHAQQLAAQHTAAMAKMKEAAAEQAREAKLGVLGHLGEMKDQALNGIKNLVSNYLSTLVSWDTRVAQWAINFATHIINGVASLPGKFLALGGQIIQALASGIKNAAGAVGNALKSIPGVGGLMNDLSGLIPHFATGGVMNGDGLAVVGENGPELVRMPGGARITPLAQGQGITGLPAGMQPAYGTATATANGQPLQFNLYFDGKKIAQLVTQHQPSVVRNGTGKRSI